MAIQIDDIKPRRSYDVGTSPQAAFTIPFPFFATDDIRCSVGGVELESGFAVTGAGSSSGGTLTLSAAVSNAVVTIWRDVAIKRASQLPASGPFKIDVLNTDLNRQVAVSQQLADRLRRSLRLADADGDVDMTLPAAAERAGNLLAFGPSGAPVAVPMPPGSNLDADGILNVSAPMRVSGRLVGVYVTPVYDLKYNTLAAAQYTEQTIAVPAGKQLDIYSVHVVNTGHGKAFGINVQMVAASPDTENTEPVRAYVGNVINEGPGEVKGLRINAGGTEPVVDEETGGAPGSTGVLMAASLSVAPASTQGTTVILQGTCTGATDDKATAAQFGSVGRLNYGILFDQGVEYKFAAFRASMGSGSAPDAKFLDLRNGAAATTFEVDRHGSVLSSVDVHAGSDRGNSVRITQSAVERTAGPGNLEVKAGLTGGNLYLRSGNNIEMTRGAGSAVSAATFSDTGMTVGSGAARVFSDAGILHLRPYTTTTLPSAATAGQQIFVSDETGGPVAAVSDGTNWRRSTDGAIVA